MGAERTALWIAAMVVAGGAPAAGGFPSEARPLAEAAVALCHRADGLPPEARREVLRRGLSLAERAVAGDAECARAHFAVFCTRGRLVELDGVGWRTLGAVRRVRHAIDRAVALSPDDVDALVGRGALLMRLPGLLGGDADEAARSFERALAIDPWHPAARAYVEALRTAPRRGGSLSSALRDE